MSDANDVELTSRVPYEGEFLDFTVLHEGIPTYVGLYLTLEDKLPTYRYFLSMGAAKEIPAPN